MTIESMKEAKCHNGVVITEEHERATKNRKTLRKRDKEWRGVGRQWKGKKKSAIMKF